MQESVSGNDDTGGETEGAEQPKDTGEQGDPAGSEDMEESDDQEDNEEAGAEGKEEKALDSENPDKEKNPEEPAEEKEPAAESGAVKDADSTYTDANGVIYHYYGYDDGTAEIYELEDCKESTWGYKALNISSRIGDYTVTSLAFSLPSDTPSFIV